MRDEPCRIRVLAVLPGDEDDPQVMVFARRQLDALERAGVQIERFWLASRTSPAALLAARARMRRRMANFDPDIVHAHFGTVTSLLCASASLRPLVITFRGSDLHGGAGVGVLRRRVSGLMSQLSVLRARAVICVSRRLEDYLWTKPALFAVVPSGLDFDRFPLMPREEARRRLGWSADEPVVLFNAGRNPAVKRQDLAEAAAERAARRIPGLRLHILAGRTPPEEMALHYNAADCLLVTSDNEGSPNVVKEALACNLPIVSVDVGDVAERLEGVHPSALVGRDPEALGAAVASIVARASRSNGRERVAALGNDRLAERVVTLYRQVLDGCPRRGAALS